jgi:glycosyltransferase involved in cell wall biosynthesis
MKLVQYTFAVVVLSLFCNQLIQCAPKNKFALIIPSFNNARYYIENLNSACWQNSTYPYHIYYINDCSTDNTGNLVAQYIKDNRLEHKVTLINNQINIGGGANIYNTIHRYIADDQIVVILDGDDLFPHDNVLLTLEEYYKNPNVWLTYGSLMTIPDEDIVGKEIESSIFENNLTRSKVGYGCTALRTFRAGLYKKIKKEDFYYKGEFTKVTWDLAFMLPMVEMCNGKTRHCIFIDEVLYLYRVNTSINDFTIRAGIQAEVDQYIRSLPPYGPLESLDF